MEEVLKKAMACLNKLLYAFNREVQNHIMSVISFEVVSAPG